MRCSLAQNQIDFPHLEAGDGNVKVKVKRSQMLQLDGKNRIVPSSFFRQLVIGQNVGSDLMVGQIVQAYGRNLLDRQEFRGLDATMAGDNHPRSIDKDRIGEAEGADTYQLDWNPGINDETTSNWTP